MTVQTKTDLQLLTDSVGQLSAALAASERRHQALARSIRWGTLAFIVLVSTLMYAGSDWIKVYAASNPWARAEDQIAASPPALGGILQSLAGSTEMQGAMVKIMQSASTIAYQETQAYLACEEKRKLMTPQAQKDTLCYSKAAVEDLGEYYLDEDGNLPQPPGPNASMQEQVAFSMKLMQGTLMSAGQAIVDGAALVHRLRRDSDLVRKTVSDMGGPTAALNGIERELQMMNRALISVPIMAGEMGNMSHQMSVMGYSMGSTMGRMGNIMPW